MTFLNSNRRYYKLFVIFATMKWFNIILSIYLVGLACMPCADIEIDSASHSLATHQSKQNNHSHDKSSDLCSPFCVCNCCGAQILSHFSTVIFEFNSVTALIKLPLPTYKSLNSSNFYGSIWQPPQIA